MTGDSGLGQIGNPRRHRDDNLPVVDQLQDEHEFLRPRADYNVFSGAFDAKFTPTSNCRVGQSGVPRENGLRQHDAQCYIAAAINLRSKSQTRCKTVAATSVDLPVIRRNLAQWNHTTSGMVIAVKLGVLVMRVKLLALAENCPTDVLAVMSRRAPR